MDNKEFAKLLERRTGDFGVRIIRLSVNYWQSLTLVTFFFGDVDGISFAKTFHDLLHNFLGGLKDLFQPFLKQFFRFFDFFVVLFHRLLNPHSAQRIEHSVKFFVFFPYSEISIP